MRDCLGPSCPNVRRIGELSQKLRRKRREVDAMAAFLCASRDCPWGDAWRRCSECGAQRRAKCWLNYMEVTQ